MAEYDAGSIEATLELNRDPFQAGLEAAKEEGEEYEREGIDVPLEVTPDRASVPAAESALKSVVRDMSASLGVRPDLASVTAADLELEEVVRNVHELGINVGIDPDLASIPGAERTLKQALVGLNTLLDVIPDAPSLADAEMALRGGIKDLHTMLSVYPDLNTVVGAEQALSASLGQLNVSLMLEPDLLQALGAEAGLQAAIKPIQATLEFLPDYRSLLEAEEEADRAARAVEIPVEPVLRTNFWQEFVTNWISTQHLGPIIDKLGEITGQELDKVWDRYGKELQGFIDSTAIGEYGKAVAATAGGLSAVKALIGVEPDTGSVIAAEQAIQRMANLQSIEMMAKAKPDGPSVILAKAMMQKFANADPLELKAGIDTMSMQTLNSLPRALLNSWARQLGMAPTMYDTKKLLIRAMRDLGPLQIPTSVAANVPQADSVYDQMKAEAKAKKIEVPTEPQVDPLVWRRLITDGMHQATLQKIAVQLGLDPNEFKFRSDLVKAIKAAQAEALASGGVKIPLVAKPEFEEGTLFNQFKAEAAAEQLSLPIDTKANLGQEASEIGKMKAEAASSQIDVPLYTKLLGYDRMAVNAIAQSMGMNLGDAMAYKTKSSLAVALASGSFGPPPEMPVKAKLADNGDGSGGIATAIATGLLGGNVMATHLIGTSLGHLIFTAIPIAVSALAAAGGGALLLSGMLGTAAVGMGTDLAGIGQAAGDIKNVATAQNQLSQAVIEFGKNSQQAANAQANLNFQLQSFSPVARQSVLAAANAANAFKAMFDQVTGPAENIGAQIIRQAIQTAQVFLPVIGKFAFENMKIIQAGLQPFFAWMRGQGLSIFTDLERLFQAQLPAGVHATVQLLEFLAKTIDLAAHYTTNLVQRFDQFITRWNSPTGFERWSQIVAHLVDQFRAWSQLGSATFRVIRDLLHLEAGSGEAIVRYLTLGLDKLHQWLNTASGGAAVHTFFEAHKQQVLDLLHAIGILLSEVGPPLIRFMTTIAQQTAPLLPIVAQIAGPLAAMFVNILDFLLKIPGVGNLAALLIVMKGLQTIPFLGIGTGFGLLVRPIEFLASGVLTRIIAGLGGSEGLIATLNRIPGISIKGPKVGETKKVADATIGELKQSLIPGAEAAGEEVGASLVASEGAAATAESGGLLAALMGPWGIAAIAAIAAGALIITHWRDVVQWTKDAGHEVAHVWDSLTSGTGRTATSTTPLQAGQKAFVDLKGAVDNYVSSQRTSLTAQQNLNRQIALVQAGKGSYQAVQSATNAYEFAVNRANDSTRNLAKQIESLPKVPYASQLQPQINAVDNAYLRLTTDELRYGANSRQVKSDQDKLNGALEVFHGKQQALATGYANVDSATKTVAGSNRDLVSAWNNLQTATATFHTGPGLKDLHRDQQDVSKAYYAMVQAGKTWGTDSHQYQLSQEGYNRALETYGQDSGKYQTNVNGLRLAQERYSTSTALAKGHTTELTKALQDLPKGAQGIAILKTDAERVNTSFNTMTNALRRYGADSSQFRTASGQYQRALKDFQAEEDRTTAKTQHTASGIVGIWQRANTDLRHWWGAIESGFNTAWQHVDVSTRHWFGDTEAYTTGVWHRVNNTTSGIAHGIYNTFDHQWQAIDYTTRHWFGNVEAFFIRFGGSIQRDASAWGNAVYHILDGAWQSVDNSARRWFGDVLNFMSGIPGAITRVLSGLGDILYGVGKSIMQGLWRGLHDAWSSGTGWLGSLGGIISRIKGPPEYDATLLQNAGRLIMGGFFDGLKQGWEHSQKLLTDVGPAIQKAVGTKPIAMPVTAAGANTSAVGAAAAGNTANFTININNPQPEPASTSLHRTMQKIRYHGIYDPAVWNLQKTS